MSEAITQETNALSEQNPERKGIKKGLYLIPTAFTAANVLMGFLSIMATLRGYQFLSDQTFESLLRASYEFDKAALFIGWATLFDALDGRVARMTKTTTEIGVQFDSIADVLTFGIAPSVLAFAWGYGSVFAQGTQLYNLGLFVSFMYLMCGSFRLARFNVQASRPRPLSEGTAKVDKKHFVGLPIPPAAGLIAGIIHYSPNPLSSLMPENKAFYISCIFMIIMGVLGLLMVSTIKYTSFKSLGTGKINIRLILIIAAIAMLVWLYSTYVLLAIALLYVLHGLVLKSFSVMAGLVVRKREQHITE